MTVRKTVGSLASLGQGTVSTAVNIAKHPIGTASLAVGFTKGVAVAGIDLLRGGSEPVEDTTAPSTPTLVQEREPEPESASKAEPTPESASAPEVEPVEDPRDELPGPDLAHFEPPAPEDLPEPIVIEADDSPTTNGESGEPFHHEPKVASREVAHGESGTDFEQADGFSDEIPDEIPGDTEVGLRP